MEVVALLHSAPELGEEMASFIRARPRGQRSALPGRCHACNRAESPEWRRGPDGSRTLCNACGLRMFYSKLPKPSTETNAISRLREINKKIGREASKNKG